MDEKLDNIHYTTMTQYHDELDCFVAFPPEKVENTLGEVLAVNNRKQLRITETEKFNHLTYFFNSKKSSTLEGEDRIMLDTLDVKTHDERPEMRTPDIAKEIINHIEEGKYDAIFTNICNGDMVGHTAKIKPVIKGVEVADKAIGEIVKKGLKHGYHIIITADHGNAEELIDEETGKPKTSHTTNPVPFILISKKYKKLNRNKGSLQDIAPTILDIMKLKTPKEMTGKSFIS